MESSVFISVYLSLLDSISNSEPGQRQRVERREEPRYSSAAAPTPLPSAPQRRYSAVTRRPPRLRAVTAAGAEGARGLHLPACRAAAQPGRAPPCPALHAGICSLAGRRKGVRRGFPRTQTAGARRGAWPRWRLRDGWAETAAPPPPPPVSSAVG